MRELVTKIIALQQLLHVEKHAIEKIKYSLNKNVTGTFSKDMIGDILWERTSNAVRHILIYATPGDIWHAIGNVTLTLVSCAENDAMKNGKTVSDMLDIVCLSVMNNHEKIFDAINKLYYQITINPKMNASAIVQSLFIFTPPFLKRLRIMNPRFRLFYFLKIHEIISILNEDENNLANQFFQSLNEVGDLHTYKNMFLPNITLRYIDSLEKFTMFSNIPNDVMKLIIEYCHLSIHNSDDLNYISKFITQGFKIHQEFQE